ncbi:hypothetical protein ACEWY4_014836 [Coilia grayii]|uniref:Phosphatidic acid phosphatase type 2/haloperoxidase domain-containing protein n=1 Tax=Coilia grayii TaxID=363190 RepID=A0ABD1JTF9_9TELE
MMGEGLIYCMQSRLKIRPGNEGSINAGGCNFNSFLRRTVRFVGVCTPHLSECMCLGYVPLPWSTDVIQLATGYHTPFFLTVCKPNYTLPGISCDRNPYITRDICSGLDQHAILSARKTFPSQHATLLPLRLCTYRRTLSAFKGKGTTPETGLPTGNRLSPHPDHSCASRMYFNSTISDSTKLLKPVLVFAFTIAAALTGLTQITQYRSHPIDVYAGFCIGAGIAMYLAFHAVANFKPAEDAVPPPAPPPPQKDALRELAQRGHDSVYQKSHAGAESNEEITSPAGVASLVGVGGGGGVEGLNRPLQREKASLGSLKRASVNVELLAPRSPMGKETMVTFSNTLPRQAANNPTSGGMMGGLDEVPVQRRLVTVPVPVPVPLPMEALHSQQLVTEWKQKSMEMRGMSLREEQQQQQQQQHQEQEEEEDEDEEEEEEGSDDGSDETTPTEEETATSSLYPSLQQAIRPPNPPAGARVVLPPRPPVAPQPPHIPHPHMPGEVPVRPPPPPVSPKSASTRAKWLSLTEKSGAAVRAPGQPRLMQVIAMSKQQGLLSGSASPRSSDTGSAASSSSVTSSSTAGTDSPPYRPPSERESAGIVTVDAHAPHHPVVQAPSSSNNPWEWRGNVGNPGNAASAGMAAESRESYELNDLNRGGYRVAKGGSVSGDHRQDVPPPPPQPEVPFDGRSRESLRRKTPLVLLDQGGHAHSEQDYYRKLPQAHRFKE